MNAMNAILQKNRKLEWKESSEGIEVILPGENTVHELNKTASFLWKNIDGRKSPADLADMLSRKYRVTDEIALRDTEDLLQELSVRGLLVHAEG